MGCRQGCHQFKARLGYKGSSYHPSFKMKANTQEKAQVAFWVTPVLHTGHDNCEHCLSNTGIHWPRTCRFSYLGYLASELRVCLPLTPSARITDMFHHAQFFKKKCALWGQNSIACVFKVSTLPNEPFLLVPFWKWRPIQSLPTPCPRCKRWGNCEVWIKHTYLAVMRLWVTFSQLTMGASESGSWSSPFLKVMSCDFSYPASGFSPTLITFQE